jgi:hypothetical protein
MGSLPSLPVDRKKSVPQPAQVFAIYSLIKIKGYRRIMNDQGSSGTKGSFRTQYQYDDGIVTKPAIK